MIREENNKLIYGTNAVCDDWGAWMEKEEWLKKQKEFLIKFAYWAVWGTSAVLLFKVVGPVLVPFVAAFLVAWLLCGPVDFVAKKTNVKRNLVAVPAVILFYGLIAALLYFAGSGLWGVIQKGFTEITAFLSDVIFPMLEKFFGWIGKITGTVQGSDNAAMTIGEESAEVIEKAGEVVSAVSGDMLGKLSGVAAGIPGILMKVLIAMIATVFMEVEFHSIMDFVQKQIPERWRKTVRSVKEYGMGTLWRCIFSYGLILLMTYIELVIGFLILRIEGAFAIAAVIAVLDILPVLGTGTILVPWGIIALAIGEYGMGTGILALYLFIVVVRNIVEPKLVGGQMGLSPVVMLPCMLVGLKFFGILGLFVLPIGVAFLKTLNDRGVIHIFKKDMNG